MKVTNGRWRPPPNEPPSVVIDECSIPADLTLEQARRPRRERRRQHVAAGSHALDRVARLSRAGSEPAPPRPDQLLASGGAIPMLILAPRTSVLCGLVAAAVCLSIPVEASARTCALSGTPPTGITNRSAARATVCLINRARAHRGLRPLRINRRLALAARRHSRDMVRRRYFSHSSLSGVSPLGRIRRTGYLHGARRYLVGENIAWASGSQATPKSIAQAWMRSPGHRANVLRRRFRDVGVGIAEGAPEWGVLAAVTYTCDFGRRR